MLITRYYRLLTPSALIRISVDCITDMITYAGWWSCRPKPLRSITFPSCSVHPHAGSSLKGVQVSTPCPFTNEHNNNNTANVVNFILKSPHVPDNKKMFRDKLCRSRTRPASPAAHMRCQRLYKGIPDFIIACIEPDVAGDRLMPLWQLNSRGHRKYN